MNTTNTNPFQLNIAQAVFTPVIDRKTFADLVGVSPRVVDGWIARGYVPVVRFSNGETESRSSLINVVQLIKQLEGGV